MRGPSVCVAGLIAAHSSAKSAVGVGTPEGPLMVNDTLYSVVMFSRDTAALTVFAAGQGSQSTSKAALRPGLRSASRNVNPPPITCPVLSKRTDVISASC